MNNSLRGSCWLLAGATLLALGGCSGSSIFERQVVSLSLHQNGQPLAEVPVTLVWSPVGDSSCRGITPRIDSIESTDSRGAYRWTRRVSRSRNGLFRGRLRATISVCAQINGQWNELGKSASSGLRLTVACAVTSASSKCTLTTYMGADQIAVGLSFLLVLALIVRIVRSRELKGSQWQWPASVGFLGTILLGSGFPIPSALGLPLALFALGCLVYTHWCWSSWLPRSENPSAGP